MDFICSIDVIFVNHGVMLFMSRLSEHREIDMGAQGIIEMEGKKTKIFNIKVKFSISLLSLFCLVSACVISMTSCCYFF